MKNFIIVLIFNISAFSQNKNDAKPSEFRKIDTEFTKEYIDNYSDEYGGNPWSKPFKGCSWYCGGQIDIIKTSTKCETIDKENYVSQNISDSDYGTCWISNENDKSKSIEFIFNKNSAKFTEIVIVNGNVKSSFLWNENSRAKKIKMFINEIFYRTLILEDSKDEQIFKFEPIGAKTYPNPKLRNKKKQWKIKLEVIEFYKGKSENVAISEIYFDGDGHDNE
jgi:hypothetical protein